MDMDPFECRLQFLALLERLNATQHSIHKVATYAVRYRNLAEDLYSCLLEQLDQASINARVNIVCVLDAILEQSKRAHFKGYQDLTRQDLARIIETVVPNNAKGNVNIGSTRKILDNWRRHKYFESGAIDTVEKPLLDREAAAASLQTANEGGFSKEDMLRRMEEDRERHKRFREEIWIRPTGEAIDAEFQQLWESTEPLDPESDYEVMMLQNMLRLPHYAWHHMLSQRSPGNMTMATTTTTTTTASNDVSNMEDVPPSVPSPSPPPSNNNNNNNNTTAATVADPIDDDEDVSMSPSSPVHEQASTSPASSSLSPPPPPPPPPPTTSSPPPQEQAHIPAMTITAEEEHSLLSPESSPLTPTST